MSSRARAWVGWVGVAAVLATIVAGVWTIDSPAQTRRRRHDEMRAQDLASLVAQVRSEAHARKRLPPASFATELAHGVSALSDPETNKPYLYRPIDKDRFEVGAVFEAEPVQRPWQTWYDVESDRFYEHGKGEKRWVIPLVRQPGS